MTARDTLQIILYMTTRDALETVLPETRQHSHSSNNNYRDTTASDKIQTILTKTWQHVTHFKPYVQRHDNT